MKLFAASIAILLSLGSLPSEALQWVAAEYGRTTRLPPPASNRAGFLLLDSAESGVTFTNLLSDAKASENQIRLNGSGVAIGDVNGDDWPDIYICGLESSNALFLNHGGWRFVQATGSPEIACAGEYSTGATFADVDGDGDLDLLVNGIGTGTKLFLNDGRGQFGERSDRGLLRRLGATTCALADIDGDGDLDLYVANYRTTTIRTTGFALMKQGEKLMVRQEDRYQLEMTPQGRVLEHGEPHVLYLNDGTGHFTPSSWTDGRFLDEDGRTLKRPPLDWGLTARFHDINRDGAPDLFVCNDFHSTDKVWINDGHGKFRLIERLALRNTSTFSMAVDFADFNHDGWDDIFVADMLSPRHARRLMQLAATDPYEVTVGRFDDRPQFDRNTLQLSRGDGTFAEIAQYSGLEASDWTWSAVLLDVDLDGHDDLLCATGHMFDTQDLDAEARIQAAGPWRKERIREKLLMFPRMNQAKIAFRNRGDLTFESANELWGFNQVGVSHGLALADLDNDGDLDLVVNALNASAGLYRNESAAPRVAVRLKGLPPNSRGIGAKIKLSRGAVPTQRKEIICGGRYLSSDDPIRVFAAGALGNDMSIEVTWRSGKRSVVKGVVANRIYEIDEAVAALVRARADSAQGESESISGRNESARALTSAATLFEDVSRLLAHTHAEDSFDDFARQPLLPRKLSQLGPGLAWFDYDGDGWDDLVIGGGKGGTLAVLHNDGNGGFSRIRNAALERPLASDATGLAAVAPAPGVRLILVGKSGYESSLPSPAALMFDVKRNLRDAILAPSPVMSGPLALADIDGDGDLDLFVGGRCRPGKWPVAASSTVFRNEAGSFKLDDAWSRPFADLGLVSGAVFADMDNDGRDDLLLAMEWGPVRLFHNTGSRLVDVTLASALDPFVGWWNGVATGDFDGDGRLDIVASNWGWNSSYQSAADGRAIARIHASEGAISAGTAKFPVLQYGDVDGDGTLDLFEAEFNREAGVWMPMRSRKALAQAIPSILDKFPSYASYNSATLAGVIGDVPRVRPAPFAPWLASTVFLNRTNRFTPVILPPEAQFAPAFAVCAADFDGDTHDDIFLSQNFFETQPTMPRLDAGRGLLLRGDGTGAFNAMAGQVSGIRVYGEGRGAAAADYDADGRLDLAVAQNGATTKLFRGASSEPGLRVRLQGPRENPEAVGAVVRLVGENGASPARCVQAGSGYWSQDSHVLVLARPAGKLKLRIRWPGGRVTESDLPTDARAVTADDRGLIRSQGEINR
ncbi:MAG: VCBS repeat-containing protein [Verrucomicrobiales bacterium]|nr:VCBS repeat-containing protein [Verrucomicrobiales bacterium]